MKVRRSFPKRVVEIRTLGPTPRRLRAAEKAIDKQRGVGTLFVDPPAETPEERIARFDDGLLESERERRLRLAADWTRARRQLVAIPDPTRIEFLTWWNCSRCPADPTYLLSMLREYEAGQLKPAEKLAELRRLRLLGWERFGHLPDWEWFVIGDDDPDPFPPGVLAGQLLCAVRE